MEAYQKEMNKFLGKSTNPRKSVTQPPLNLRGEIKKKDKSRILSVAIKYIVNRKERANIA